MKMKHLAAAAAAMGMISVWAEELSIDRAFAVNGRMHVFVSAADWTNDVSDYALKSSVPTETSGFTRKCASWRYSGRRSTG